MNTTNKPLSTHQDSPFSRARIPALMSDAWPSVLAVGLLATTGSASAAGWSTSTTATQVAPGGTFTVTSTYTYDGNCHTRARVRYVSGSCTPAGDTGWQWTGNTDNYCASGGTASRTYTMAAAPTAPCLVSGDGTDNSSHYYQNTYTIKATQSISVTTAPPGSALGGTSFPVAATATSGLPVSVGVSGNCSYAAPNVTMTKTTGSCTVTFSQVGDATWVAATNNNIVYTVAATGLAQTITVTTPAPASADYNSTFTVAATTNAMPARSVAITADGITCSVIGGGSGSATIKMISGTGNCTVKYNQTDNTPSYAPAAEVISTTAAQKLPQAISFPDQTTASRVFVNNGTFAISPTATGSGSGIAITYSSLNTGICTVSGTTVTMKSVGNCVLAADQAGNANYSAAPQATQIVMLTKALQSIDVTQSAPGVAGINQSFNVKARAVPSNLPVSIQGLGACSGSGTSTNSNVTITMNSAVGLCTVLYTQDGDANYEAANPVTQYVQPSSSSGCLGEGTYTGLQLGSSGGYIGWACNDGDYIAPGHNVSCWPPIWWNIWPIYQPGWSIQPGSGFKGHVLQTKLNPGKTFRFQLAPGETQYYNVLNETDKTCLITGNAIYEYSGTRRGSNANAGYLTAIQDTATMPRGEYCDYGKNLAQWKINDHGGYITLQSRGYPAVGDKGCIGSDGLGLSRLLIHDGDGNYGDWGDTWVRNAVPSCNDNGAKLTCQGYQPPLPDHLRFEFNAATASVCTPANVTIKVCANEMPALGESGNCTVFGGYGMLTPQASRGTWQGLTSAPMTGFSGQSSGISLSHSVVNQSADLSYAYKSMSLANNTLECYDTGSNMRVSCAAALTFKKCDPFDAVEVGHNPQTNLYTKLAGTAFSFDVVGMVSYTDDLTVDVVDVSSGIDACDAAVPVLQSLGTAAFSGGRKTYATTHGDAVARAQVRIKDIGNNCYKSTDTFSIRPKHLALVVGAPAGGSTIAGAPFSMQVTARNSGDTTTASYTGEPQLDRRYIYDWHYKDASGVISDPPLMALADLPQASLTGSFGAAAAGVATGSFQYGDIGKLYFINHTDTGSSIADNVFTQASNDQQNGDCADSYSYVMDADGKYGCYIGSTYGETVRFRPDHYEVTLAFAPACTAGSNSFTYLGQAPQAPPTVTIVARSSDGRQMVRLFADYPLRASLAIYGRDGNNLLSTATPPAPVTADPVHMELTRTPCFGSTDPTQLRDASHCPGGAPVFDWPHASLDGVNQVIPGGIYENFATGFIPKPAVRRSYDAFGFRVAIQDPEAVSSGADTKIICNGVDVGNQGYCDSTAMTRYRFGLLKLDNAYGSELLPLYLNATAMYWDGTAWQKNTDDSCTALSIAVNDAGSNSVFGNVKGSLEVDDLTVSSAASEPLSGGMRSIRFDPPGVGKSGSVEVVLNLGDPADVLNAGNACVENVSGLTSPAGAGLKYLQGSWCNNGSGQNPHARINFGTAKTPVLYKRLH